MSNQFEKDTIKPDIFVIENVNTDNVCFYRSVVNCILKNNKLNQTFKEKIPNDTCSNDEMCLFIQKMIYSWIKNNLDLYIEDFDSTVKDLILITHDCNYKEYIERYKFFSKIEEITDDDLWGGLIEQIAVSNLFSTNISILTPQKYDKTKQKIINGKIINNKAEKNVRFRNIQNINNKSYTNDIYLLWKKYNKQGHYMSLYINI